ncbi:helix-turn-helix domain-containing protein [Streptomyces californicus]|uniref:helix-turn-helix domain-containing protein n=1 Tax=Streptomyces californicus TaxID=67351 RepID=UPI0036521821
MSAPTVRRRQLGRMLRALREARGLTQDEVAALAGGSLYGVKVSRIEGAKNAASASDVTRILDALEVSDTDLRDKLLKLTREGARRGWWQSYRSVLSPEYEDLIRLESEADQISTWQPGVIPGLLQTGEYARQIIAATAMSAAVEERVDALVEVRLARQSVLSRETPLALWAIIGEAALRTRCADGGIMYDHLGRLLALAARPTITIQVLPSTAPPHVGQMGSWSILSYGAHADLSVAYMESLTSALYVEQREDVALYLDAAEQLRAAAMSTGESMDVIREIRDQK